jgi:hypothetical protein
VLVWLDSSEEDEQPDRAKAIALTMMPTKTIFFMVPP